MNPQQIIDLARIKLDAAMAFNTRQITEEQYIGVHNVAALLAGEAGLLVPGRVIPSDLAIISGAAAELKPRQFASAKSTRKRGK